MFEIIKNFKVTLSPYEFNVSAKDSGNALSAAMTIWLDNEDAFPEAITGTPIIEEIQASVRR